ncbi:PIG-L family deacetylase [Desertivirga brevis]|uniref:PIG-L family deacetylase n=1 Tax=Desertivirga brevis TaxID=2810310 RepID=UPI001A967656|nr:PIG-L family deacetylase [Pedobacter sp. SYSU D00873]
MNVKLSLFALLLLSSSINAQTSIQLSSSEIKLQLEKLNVTGSVLYIAAHPDDENTRLLSYLSSERKVRTGYLSLTRGDGGQNLIGSEQAEQLGLIRTQELLAARRIDGAEQFFTRANDFGFSKTSEETFRIWNKEQILADVVWVIRKFKPDVIITRFPGDARAGHGHHAASSLLAQEAFVAAADPGRFPEQLKKVQPWKTKRIYWNTFNFGGNNTTSEDQMKIDVGGYNALLGKSYGEIASESRSQHKSQGFGVAKQRGEAYEYFALLNGPGAKNDILDDIDLSWGRIKNGTEIRTLINKINQNYDIKAPQQSVPDLIQLHSLLSLTNDNQFKDRKLKEVANLILAAAGIWVEAYSTQPFVSIGEGVPLRIQAISRYNLNPALTIFHDGKQLGQNVTLTSNKLETIEGSVKANQLSQPYWLAEKHSIGEYTIKDNDLIGNPENPNPLTLSFTLNIAGKDVSFRRPVVYKFTDPIRGEVYRNLEVTPPVISEIQSSQYLFSDNKPKEVAIKLKAFKDKASGVLNVSLPRGWKIQPSSAAFQLANKGDEETFTFTLSPEAKAESGKLKAEIKMAEGSFSKALHTIQYNHIPAITWFPESEANVIKLDIKTEGRNIAYIPGAGDLVPDALRQIGYSVTSLTAAQASAMDLSKFDAIITGVRLYNIEPQMKQLNAKLLKYVENGGILLVQYNVSQPLVLNNIGPFPFGISRDRVTEEDAKVTILQPANRIFNYPNKITEADFQNWIQERGIYYTTNLNEKYQALLSMKDTGEKEQTGSLIVADYGKGRFVYTGLAFFRQLPAGVSGAYRLFVNLITK